LLRAGPDQFRHLATVLRRGAGDAVVVLDGRGGVFDARIETIDAALGRLELRVGAASAAAEPPAMPLCAAVAIPRGDGLELAVRLASETGLAAIQPLWTARTVARTAADSQKLARWRRVAFESAEQCRRSRPLELSDPMGWKDFLAGIRAGSAWIALPGGPWPDEAGLLEALWRGGRAPEPSIAATVAIGPEGGFSDEELALAREAGLQPLGLPAPILRTPTAVIYLGALAAWALAPLDAPPRGPSNDPSEGASQGP
jgi:16S rRNA (uracil1498-N3)-methyltransferase